MSDEPELRPGPPWVMDEMISAELELPQQIAAEGGPEQIAARIREADAAGDPIVVCGTGTSEHAAKAIAAILTDVRPGRDVVAMESFETQLAPPHTGLVISISHGAGTAVTRRAATGAAHLGARSVYITARPADAPDGVEVVATPRYDRSWCHTVAYVSAILSCALGAGLPADRAQELIAAELAARDERRRDAAVIAGSERLLIVGSGVDEITASELALKIEEATHLPCTPLGTEKVLHGHLPAADSRTGAVLLRFDASHGDQRDARSADVAAATAELEMPTVTLATPGLTTVAETLLSGAIALQLLTLELAMARGTNPDLIRREQPLYRRVAEIGKAG